MDSTSRSDLPSKIVMRDNTEDMSVEAGWRVDVTPLILGLETSVHFAVTQGEIHALVETSVNDAMLVAVDSNGWVYSLNNLLSSPKDWGWFRIMTVDTAIGAVGLVVDEGQGPPTLVVVVELEPTAKPEWAAPCSEPILPRRTYLSHLRQ
jgi:hypothetical protein